jgi:hypothetical protein
MTDRGFWGLFALIVVFGFVNQFVTWKAAEIVIDEVRALLSEKETTRDVKV